MRAVNSPILSTVMTFGMLITMTLDTGQISAQVRYEDSRNLRFASSAIMPDFGNTPPSSNVPLGPGNVYPDSSGTFIAVNLPLLAYIEFAYRVTGNQTETLERQLPSWALSDRFDVRAKAERPVTKDEMRMMVRSLLNQNFGLIIHSEMKEQPVFALRQLTPGRMGPALHKHEHKDDCASDPQRNNNHTAAQPTHDLPRSCGGILFMRPSALGRLKEGGRDVSMRILAEGMKEDAEINLPIIDETGMTGTFDFSLEWSPKNSAKLPYGMSPDQSGPSFSRALKDQLGLVVKPSRGPLETLVLDQIHQPVTSPK